MELDSKYINVLDLFSQCIVFKGLDRCQLKKIVNNTFLKEFRKGEYIFLAGEPCNYFNIVVDGLIKTYVSSIYGTKITYLLSGKGEPLNLVGPFTGEPRLLEAQAIKDSCVAYIKRKDFVSFAKTYPSIIINVIGILGAAINSANHRIIDLLEKKVDQRLYKILYTLYSKFGPKLNFTSQELADLGGTTVESILRSVAELRELGIIKTKRGEIEIVKPDELKRFGEDILWI